jgi:mono/diheme cytochrome c family protein
MLTKILIPVLAMGLALGFSETSAKKVNLAAGKKTFQTFCFTCHGAKGKGDGPAGMSLNPKPRNFTDTAFMSKESKEKMYSVIADGGKKNGLSPMMAAWKTSLKPDQINDVLAYVLTFSEDSTKAIKDVMDKGKTAK